MILVLVIFLLIVFIYWRSGPEFNIAGQSIEREGKILILNEAAIADWRVYHSAEYGFEFRYPAEWQAVEKILTDRPTVKEIFLAPLNLSYPLWSVAVWPWPVRAELLTKPNFHFIKENKIYLGNLAVREKIYYGPDGFDQEMVAHPLYIIKGKNFIYTLEGKWCQGEWTIACDQLLATFKLIN